MAVPLERFVHEEEESDHPVRYLPIRHLYSNTSPRITTSGSSNVMSKKVKARKLTEEVAAEEEGKKRKPIPACDRGPEKKSILVYHRRGKRPRHSSENPSFYDSLVKEIEAGKAGEEEKEEEGVKGGRDCGRRGGKKRKRSMKYELMGLRAGSGFARRRTRTRVSRANRNGVSDGPRRKVRKGGASKENSSASTKSWVELSFDGADPLAFVDLTCKVFWPMDDDWYTGSITGYSLETGQHCVEYNDGDVENLSLMNEGIKFYISREEMQCLNLKLGVEKKVPSHDEILSMAASCNDCQDLEPGELVWAKLTGHAMWPAVVINEAHFGARCVLKPIRGERAIHVQFFGTHDFARIKIKQAVPYLHGLLSFFHQKCKQRHFQRSLEEANMYLCKQELPDNMLRLQKGVNDNDRSDSTEDPSRDERTATTVECIKTCPLEMGDLRVTDLGKIVCDSRYFHSKNDIWPEGYTAFRKFISVTDPNSNSYYKMEVLRNPKSKSRPLFRVTLEDGERIEGPRPSVCWKEIYSRIRKKLCDGSHVKVEECMLQNSGSYMFGFSITKISQLIQGLPNSSFCSKYLGSSSDLPASYQPVNLGRIDLDRCNVCDMDEEYDGNLFLQCDKCRILVHARCYGELEPLNGMLWLCNLCRPGAPKSPPQCCLCPVTGGAIKPTTDGRWAHLTCAMWIPETCLLDVKRMEPIDGLSRINKYRWKLLCSICGVPYGACIQCSNSTCRVAYHPLCARSAGLCFELADEDLRHLMSMDEDDDQCIHLLSFCKKHRQPSNECPPSDDKLIPPLHCSTHVCLSNPSGCARSEPYNFFGRRGQREPQVLAAASVKRLFVENRPYLVSGCYQNGMGNIEPGGKISFPIASKLETRDVARERISSMTEKYTNMKATFRKRLAFGKSRIHGFGVFTKLPHKAGDMVIEYTGELVRPSIADMREHLIYNSLVGAGTYMFRIDNERVIDATRAGSIAHLINHSCEPNCYSRGITVDGDEHIIIFAKRDIVQWEELTYDYRFFSIDEQLSCYCGFPRCRGIVNDIEAEEQVSKIWAPRSELIPWKGE